MPDCFVETGDGVVLIANGIDPVLRWDGSSAAAQLAGLTPPDQDAAPVIAGSGVGSITGTYRAYVRFVAADGRVSNLSPVSNELTVTGVQRIDYTDLPAATQPGVKYRQLLRNTDGQFDVFYVDVETQDLTSAALSGTKLDSELSTSEEVVLLDEDNLPLANRHDPPPATKPVVVVHQGRAYYLGSVTYAEGSCRVTRFSATVTGVGTEWKATFAGRFFHPQGGGRAYEIEEADPVNQTLTLTEAYEGESDDFLQYAVKPPPADIKTVYFSEPNLYESVPPFNAFTIPEDGDEVTGATEFGSFLWIFERRRTYRFTCQTDPGEDGFLFHALARGCVNNRCHAIVEEQLYALDEGGVYRTGGGDQMQTLSEGVQNLFRRAEAGSVNWAASRFFHASYSPAEDTVRFFVVFNGDYLPRHSLSLHYKTGRWWKDEYAVGVGCSALGRAGPPTNTWGESPEQIYLGGAPGELYALGGSLDGVADSAPSTRGRATAGGMDTLTDAAASFDTTWANVPVTITGGRGRGQRRLVVSATATTLRVSQPWAVKPDSTSTYQVGGVPFRYTSGRLRYAPGEQQQARSVELQYAPTALGVTAELRLVHDFAALARASGRDLGPGQRNGVRAARPDPAYELDLSKPYGAYYQRFDGHREGGTDGPRLVAVQIRGSSAPEMIRFGEMVLVGVVR